MPDDKTAADAPAPKAKKNGGPAKAAAPVPTRKLGLPNMRTLQARLKLEAHRKANPRK